MLSGKWNIHKKYYPPVLNIRRENQVSPYKKLADAQPDVSNYIKVFNTKTAAPHPRQKSKDLHRKKFKIKINT